jgi:hypothetical protein
MALASLLCLQFILWLSLNFLAPQTQGFLIATGLDWLLKGLVIHSSSMDYDFYVNSKLNQD